MKRKRVQQTASLAICLILVFWALPSLAFGQSSPDWRNADHQEALQHANMSAPNLRTELGSSGIALFSSTPSPTISAIPPLIWVIIGILVLTVLGLTFALWWVVRQKLGIPNRPAKKESNPLQ
jgi:hypothetical protein